MYPVALTLLISGIVQDWLWLLLTMTFIDQSLFFVWQLSVSSRPYIVDVWYCSGLVMVIINHNVVCIQSPLHC